jgi:hypothetical protein
VVDDKNKDFVAQDYGLYKNYKIGIVTVCNEDILEFEGECIDESNLSKIISHAPLNGAPYLDSVDRLPPIDNGDDVEILVPFPGGNEYRDGKEIGVWMEGWIEGHEEGYNKAREKYKFTEEDARLLIMCSFLKGVDRGHYSTEIEDRIIQSLQHHPKLPIAFECEMITRVYDVYPQRTEYKPKTIINSEGRTEWVGKYIYE